MLEQYRSEEGRDFVAPTFDSFDTVEDSAESNSEMLKSAADQAEKAALEMLKKFETSPDSKENLAFHNQEHTKAVIERTNTILEAIQEVEPSLVSDRDASLARIASAFHDVVQEWQESPVDGKVMRKRFIGTNEEKSAEAAIEFMRGVNKEAGKDVFTFADGETIKLAMKATVPGFDGKLGTVVQPGLTNESGIVARALALSDLGTAGIDGPEKYLPEGDALFREENLDILEALSTRAGSLTDDEKTAFLKRINGWTGFQSVFAAGRKARFETEVAGLPLQVQEKLRSEVFNKFDESIEAAKAKAERRAKLSFEEAARDMGYDF